MKPGQICTGFIICTFHVVVYFNMHIGKTCAKRPLSKRKCCFQDQLSLNAGQKYCRMLQESILQYIRPTLSYHLSLRSLVCLFLSCRFTIRLTSTKLSFVIKIFVLSIFSSRLHRFYCISLQRKYKILINKIQNTSLLNVKNV